MIAKERIEQTARKGISSVQNKLGKRHVGLIFLCLNPVFRLSVGNTFSVVALVNTDGPVPETTHRHEY